MYIYIYVIHTCPSFAGSTMFTSARHGIDWDVAAGKICTTYRYTNMYTHTYMNKYMYTHIYTKIHLDLPAPVPSV